MYKFLCNKIAALYSGFIGKFSDMAAFFSAQFYLQSPLKIYTFSCIPLHRNRTELAGIIMKIEHMRYIIEVSRWKSINKASQHLYINQQQLSRIIASVEADLDIEIFYRNTKGIFLTPQGEEIVQKFEQILSIYDSIRIQEEKADTIAGRLDILTEINIWTSYARFYKDFAKTYPNVQCFIKNMASEEIVQTLLQQNGVGIISRVIGEDIPSYAIPDSLEFSLMSKEHLMVYGAANNPYIKKYKTISMATLCELPLINFKPYDTYPSLMEQALQNIGAANIKYEVSNIKVFHEILAETDCLFLAIKKPQYIIADAIGEIPLRNKIYVEHGVVKKKTASALCDIFLKYYQNYYKGLYAD